MKPRLNVYLTTAKRVYKFAYPVIESLFENNQDSEVYLYIVSEDLEQSDISKENALADNYGNHIIILRFDENMAKEHIKVAPSDHWPLGTLGCYWLFHELLPKDVDRIMAIESDAIVTGSLKEFYETDFAGNYAICPDPEHKPLSHRELMKRIDGDLLTFVPSVYNVGAIRNDFTLDDILKADKKGADELGHSQQELTFGILFKNKIKFVPAQSICVEENSASIKRFGYEYLEECEQTEKLIHFSSTGAKEKPWDPVYFLPGYSIWWKYALKSPYYDFYIENQNAKQEERIREINQIKRNISYKNILILSIIINAILISLIGIIWYDARLTWIITVLIITLASVLMSVCFRFVSILITRRGDKK